MSITRLIGVLVSFGNEEGTRIVGRERIFAAFFRQMAITLIETVARTRGVVMVTMNISGRHPLPLLAIPKFVFLPSIVNINSTCVHHVKFPIFPLYVQKIKCRDRRVINEIFFVSKYFTLINM